MAENIQKVILSADDQTRAAFESFRANLRSAKDAADNLNKTSAGLKDGLNALKATLTVALFADATQKAVEFDKSLAQISTQLDGTGDDLTRLEAAAKSLAVEFGTPPVDQTRAFYEIISAGTEDATKATEILTSANKLAVVGVTDLATSVSGLTDIMNSYKGKVESAEAVSDALFVGMKAGKASMEDFTAHLAKVTLLPPH